jgi:hypothetical protein
MSKRSIPGVSAPPSTSGTSLLKLDRYDEALAAFEQAQDAGAGSSLSAGAMAAAVLGGCDLERWPQMQHRLIEAVRSAARRWCRR